MVKFDSLVISLPAHELSGASFSESVFTATELNKSELSPDLRTALDVILNNCVATSMPVRCIARPELFTHGASLEWLKKKIDGVTDHLHLSDGMSVKLIPGLSNHVFIYGLQSTERATTFKKLMRRAPELLQQFQTQLNSFHRAAAPGSPIVPTPQIVMLKMPLHQQILWFYAFYLNPHSTADSVDHILNWGELEEKKLVQFERVTYLPLTDIAIRDFRFQKMVCKSIASTYFDEKHCLLIRLPLAGVELSSRMYECLECIRGAGLQIPRARAHNVFFLAEDLSEQTLQRLGSRVSLVLHQTFEFWRYTRRMYEAAGKITYYSSVQPNASFDSETQLLTDAFGRRPDVVFPKHASGESFMPESDS